MSGLNNFTKWAFPGPAYPIILVSDKHADEVLIIKFLAYFKNIKSKKPTIQFLSSVEQKDGQILWVKCINTLYKIAWLKIQKLIGPECTNLTL